MKIGLFYFLGFLLLMFIDSNECHATHIAGGELTYRYVGGNNYRIMFTLYKKINPVDPPSAISLSINSSCFSSTVMLPKDVPPGGMAGDSIPFPDKMNCGDTASVIGMVMYTYSDTIALPPCSDYVFSYKVCCRPLNIDNLIQSGTHDFYIEAHLNSMHGPNSSPSFLQYPVYAECMGEVNTLNDFAVWEVDGDSILYSLALALDGQNIPVPYDTGYSYLEPFGSPNLASGYELLKYVANQAGEFTIVLTVSEYRYDPTFSNYFKVSSVTRDYIIEISANCNNKYASNVFGKNNMDTIQQVFCGDSIIEIEVKPIAGASLALNGTDFEIYDSQNNIWAIAEAGAYTATNLMAEKIWLKMTKPVTYNDTFRIYLRNGMDGNTLVGGCGAYPVGDSTLIRVTDCQDVDLVEIKVTDSYRSYPNPVQNVLTVDIPSYLIPHEIQILDVHGKLIKSLNSTARKMEIDVSFLPAGIYFISTKNDSQELIGKFHKL